MCGSPRQEDIQPRNPPKLWALACSWSTWRGPFSNSHRGTLGTLFAWSGSGGRRWWGSTDTAAQASCMSVPRVCSPGPRTQMKRSVLASLKSLIRFEKGAPLFFCTGSYEFLPGPACSSPPARPLGASGFPCIHGNVPAGPSQELCPDNVPRWVPDLLLPHSGISGVSTLSGKRTEGI